MAPSDVDRYIRRQAGQAEPVRRSNVPEDEPLPITLDGPRFVVGGITDVLGVRKAVG